MKIFTARVSTEDEEEKVSQIEKINAWVLEVFDTLLPITCCKDFGMLELYDDRCTEVVINTGRLVKDDLVLLAKFIYDNGMGVDWPQEITDAVYNGIRKKQ